MDWLPSYNLNLWVVPDEVVVRYYYGEQISRPDIGQLLPGGTCTIDERNEADSPYFDGDGESVCTGRVGNPALKPLSAVNQSINLEWYPNRDTSVSLVYQKSDIEIGGARGVDVTGPLFNGSGVLDPVSQQPVDDLIFQYPTYENSPGFQRTGLEFTAKTAFTFLPWLLRYTGADFNYSTLKASTAVGGEYDPITGEVFSPRGQSEYYANLSLWYDDGRFTDETKYLDAKVSYNVNDNIQVFLEGTNLTKQAASDSTGGARAFENGAPTLWRQSWSGMRVRTGATFKFQ